MIYSLSSTNIMINITENEIVITKGIIGTLKIELDKILLGNKWYQIQSKMIELKKTGKTRLSIQDVEYEIWSYLITKNIIFHQNMNKIYFWNNYEPTDYKNINIYNGLNILFIIDNISFYNDIIDCFNYFYSQDASINFEVVIIDGDHKITTYLSNQISPCINCLFIHLSSIQGTSIDQWIGEVSEDKYCFEHDKYVKYVDSIITEFKTSIFNIYDNANKITVENKISKDIRYERLMRFSFCEYCGYNTLKSNITEPFTLTNTDLENILGDYNV